MSISFPVFGTELLFSTSIIVALEVIILMIQFVFYLKKSKDKSRLSFLILITAFLAHNLADGLLPDNNFNLSILIQYIITYITGFFLAFYYFYYLVKELELELNAIFNPKTLLIVLITTFCLTYLVGYYITEDFHKAKMLFVGFSVVIALYFCFNTVYRLSKMKLEGQRGTPFELMAYTGHLGIVFMAIFPIADAMSDSQFYPLIFANISFFLSAWSYLMRYVFQNRIKLLWFEYKEEENKESIGNIINLLTSREIEVSYMIIQPNMTYSKIAKKMYVSDKTISKHASNIFKKIGVKNRKEFLLTYVLEK